MISNTLKITVRTKATTTVNPSTQRVVNQLSALSASRKQPKLIKLSHEDLIKHNTIQNAWKSFTRKQETKRYQQLQQQYESIHNAMDTLKAISPSLYQMANKSDENNWYPLNMRVPTDYPANMPWVYNHKNQGKA
ncbi:hypothetical protein PSN45_003793 [Yamadazyma tenuis]|uniref:Large ribosomal subunit protein mL40 n=1 Tax=Candida tenuis (strain ATCC 10573 / BCRC 21748 / CBS 615 / JCM 9827 / NBRC 10315 / NRRL Y-1498 / VKM Y-70) TaxID=590646 RepID=G3B386_CANTC|nr:uncharacterized protein CANTEDRAFT_98094 [Yamadazyma tenuis ATCC 10573]EGV64107.1 hypothetical protein CANTEDRAFT_98094 [Yamadazyma tenuis ATCC 10573]WEJ96257.1 hypothetical protein PSN45_003793 [Yamadazyma tenuis]